MVAAGLGFSMDASLRWHDSDVEMAVISR